MRQLINYLKFLQIFYSYILIKIKINKYVVKNKSKQKIKKVCYKKKENHNKINKYFIFYV